VGAENGGKTTVLVEMDTGESAGTGVFSADVSVRGRRQRVTGIDRDYLIKCTTVNGTRREALSATRLFLGGSCLAKLCIRIVAGQSNLLEGIRGGSAETTGRGTT